MRFLIYGAGALGQALGCLLKAQDHQVDFVLRKRFIQPLLLEGLRVSGIFGEYKAALKPENLLEEIDPASKRGYDYVLITTKAYDTKAAIQNIAAINDQISCIVSMQNGCGNVEMLEQHFGAEKVLGARIITGFEISAPGRVNITVSADAIHVGGCKRGIIPQGAKDLADTISKAGHHCLAVEDIYQSLFAKLLYNCTLNPLGAILGVHYGLLGERQETRDIMSQIIDETYAVITALGGKTIWQNSDEYKKLFFDQLLPATYNHRPSMLQDLENRKPTEIDALCGYVVHQGRHLNIPTPVSEMLTSLVKFKESDEPSN